MNSDLISKQALIARHKDLCCGECDCCLYQTKELECKLILDAPVVETEAAQHSKWLQHRLSVPKGRGQTYLVYGCYVCHGHVRKRSPFCPNCGAKMDGKDEENNG